MYISWSILRSLLLKSCYSSLAVKSRLDYSFQNCFLLHFLLTWSTLTGTSSQKIRLQTHRSSILRFSFRNVLIQGSISLPNNLPNSMSTFSDRSESLTAVNLNLLSPFFIIRWILSILVRISLSSIFSPILMDLNPSLPRRLMYPMKYQEYMRFRKVETARTGQIDSEPSLTRLRSMSRVLEMEIALWKGTIY